VLGVKWIGALRIMGFMDFGVQGLRVNGLGVRV